MSAQHPPNANASPPLRGEAVRCVELTCPAKLNLALCVGAPGSDGFHPLAGAMLALAWGDDLRLEQAGQTAWQRAWVGDAPKPSAIDWPEEKDLAICAHHLLEQHVGHSLPVKAHLGKRIPAGAGLGGGSADAAGVLVGLNRLFELRLRTQTLCDLAAKLGSDAPFFVQALSGHPLCLATGRGECLEPFPVPEALEKAYFTLVFPHSSCPTPAVYQAFDALGQFGVPAGEGLDQARAVARDERACFNDLALAASRVAPEVGIVLAQLRGQGVAAHMTGSGSCVFVRAESYGGADHAAGMVRAAMDLPTRVVRALRQSKAC